ncbi:hypothetical protein GSI_05178 [Ganoderma sinense ZZ0214-1]|uniref:Fungal-type protein kinase domain-containing protein n=1 Tax=Ganoderma sinense ZZ0214-1 TaxID=1077348 RepID=A0A2G8SFB8_9APHY|nr:hypothetical protein GSI_05178 [Ganoderma sinense ZZ0214-1]
MAKSVVQLDYDGFFRAFLSPPYINFRPKRASPIPFSQLKCANDFTEDSISQHFITAVRTHHLTPESTLATTLFDALSTNREAKHKIQAGIYRSTDIPKRGHPHWADQKVSFQFTRYVAGVDPFEPRKFKFGFGEDCTETGRELERETLCEHIYAIAELLFAAQHRVFLFMVLIIGRRFRLLRWDRAGVIVTPSVDYVEQSILLCDCLRRLSLLDDISLGFDPTATRLRPRDSDFLRMDATALDDPRDVDHTERRIEEDEIGDTFVFRYVRSSFRDSLSAGWPRYQLRVRDCDDTRDFLVGKPLHLPSGVIGRGTRGYVALDCKTQRFVWLKDAWRACDLATDREGDILGKLNLAGVANVPTLLCHGDVQEQMTITDEWWIRPDEDGKSRSMVWTGILADWELAKPIDTGRSLQAHRVGTHQFMSVNLLSDPFRPVTVPDELESFFHALVYFSVRYLRSNCPSPTSWINSYFLASGMPDMYLGGMKTAMIQDEGRLTMLLPPGPLLFNSPMDKLLSGLIKGFTAHYKVMAHELEQSRSPSWSSSSAASSPDAAKTGPQAAAAARPKTLVVLPSFSDDPELVAALAARKAYKPPDTTPTAEDRELAHRVEDHDFALDFIATLLRHKGWPDDDRTPVLPVPTSDPRPEPEPEPEPEPQFASGGTDPEPAPKRRRRATPKAKTTGALAQTTRPPATAPRMRKQTRAVSRSKSRPGRRS